MQIWIVNLDKILEPNIYYNLLDEQEKFRASQFAFDYLKKQYVVTRGILRRLLTQYLSIKNDQIYFRYGSWGKPYIDNGESLQFNLSHSGNMVVYGFAKLMEIGIDIELIKENFICAEVEEYIFSNLEKKTYTTIKSSSKKRAFYNAWACKEAILKALGTGFYISPNEVEIPFNPLEYPKFVNIKDNQFCIHKVDIGYKEYVGAVAIASPSFNIKMYEYDEKQHLSY
ncbi:4'-phosphopantetheinyl transferase family protein [Parachlamydia acanthamoebae]|uniref:4'-phosphopantetheinyl transferase family protein n=1 Tax=Parachlamydia acanthamoebae TaxID=83552 RepID=UPI00137927C9|nr:4'-phosphopantetheinyl transferase superfamily protein [Parachlamydia acanthamoebae]